MLEVQQGADHVFNILSGDFEEFMSLEVALQKGKKRMKHNDLNRILSQKAFLSELKKREDSGDILSRTFNRIIKDKETAMNLLESERGTRLFEKIFANELSDYKFNRQFINELKKSRDNKRMGEKGNFFKKHLQDR